MGFDDTARAVMILWLQRIWMAIGLVVYLAIGLFLPITVPLLGVFSDMPETWVRLMIPMIMIPFMMGYAQPLFMLPARVQLGAPAALFVMIAITAVIDSVKTKAFLTQDLIFWPLMIATYLVTSWAGLRVRRSIQVSKTKSASTHF